MLSIGSLCPQGVPSIRVSLCALAADGGLNGRLCGSPNMKTPHPPRDLANSALLKCAGTASDQVRCHQKPGEIGAPAFKGAAETPWTSAGATFPMRLVHDRLGWQIPLQLIDRLGTYCGSRNGSVVDGGRRHPFGSLPLPWWRRPIAAAVSRLRCPKRWRTARGPHYWVCHRFCRRRSPANGSVGRRIRTRLENVIGPIRKDLAGYGGLHALIA